MEKSDQVAPDNVAAVVFLRRFYPEGPWLLTAIEPDRKGIETRTFTASQVAEMSAWLAAWNGRRNLYFSVNPPIRPLSQKAEREEILCMAWLHVDVDPRAGEDLLSEQGRCAALFNEKLPKGVPPPTAVIFSGGGYQGFWKLEEPFAINGQVERYEEAARYTKQLELIFGGDHCFNVDRIMRLPGSVNIPDAKKLKKGRARALARLVEFHEDRVYKLSQFTPAPQVQSPSGDLGTGGSPIKVQVNSGNLRKLATVDELDEWGVPDRVKVIIVQGRDPDNPKPRDNSRSAWVFDACCQLVRAGVPDEVIFSVLMDADFGISESVLGAGSNAERYALRQIQRAKEEAEEPWLRRLNEKHAVIRNWGGKCRVVEEVVDAAFGGRGRLTKQSFDDFRNSYMHILVEAGKKADGTPALKPLGRFWLEHSARRQYDYLVFAPGREVEGAYNLWRGFAVEARPGECGLFLSHIREVICGGVAEHYDYLVRWMARAVQHPDSHGEVAVVMRGGRGTGKSLFSKTLGRLFGRHFLQVSDPKHLVGSFNAHLRDCVILFGDEAFYAGDKKHESVLKTLITEETLTIEGKGVDVEAQPNYVHVLLAGNENWVVPAGPMERRFLVLDVSDKHIQDQSYFDRVHAELNGGGREALLHYLLNLDLSSFNVRAVPKTSALREQQLLSLNADEAWWYAKLERAHVLEDDEHWSEEVGAQALIDDFVEHCKQFNVTRRGNEVMLGFFLRKVCPPGYPRQKRRVVKVDKQTPDGYTFSREARQRFYGLPSLAECRAHWDKTFGSTSAWAEEPPPEGRVSDSIPF